MNRISVQFLLAVICLLSLRCGSKALIENGVPSEPLRMSETELAEPPAGEVRGVYLRSIKPFRDAVQRELNESQGAARGGERYSHLKALKHGLDVVLASRANADLFNLIPEMAWVLGRHETVGGSETHRWQGIREHVRILAAPLIHSMAEYLTTHGGNVSGDTLEKFVTVWSTDGFYGETDWEGDEVPMWSTDLFVANADGVIKTLEARPWQCTQRFIGGGETTGNLNTPTADEFFGGYGSDEGVWIKVLGPKYLTNKSTLTAKFNALREWLLQQQEKAGRHAAP